MHIAIKAFFALCLFMYIATGAPLQAATPEESRQRILQMPIPDFRALSPHIDDRLNEILQRALARDLDRRYPTADELLYDLEHYIYHSGYGPTNETLGRFVRELFAVAPPAPANAAPPAPTEAAAPAAPPPAAIPPSCLPGICPAFPGWNPAPAASAASAGGGTRPRQARPRRS